MPAGVEVTIDEDGVATVVFTDPTQRFRGVGDLLDAASSPDEVQKVTHPQVAYVVPVQVARDAGMVDGVSATPASSTADDEQGKPDMEWHRAALDHYAAGLGLDPKQYSSKPAVLEAIRAAEA